MTQRADLLFDAEMSSKYHRRRAAFLERTSAAMSSAILFGGAGAFASLFGTDTLFAKITTAFVALVGVIQIVFQTDRCAAEHRQWLRQWNAILADVKRNERPSPEQLAEWQNQQYAIESECVGEMRALQEDCYNRTMAAHKLVGQPTKITRWQRFWMQLFSFENAFQPPETK